MESISRLRKAHQESIARFMGTRGDLPRLMVSQRKAEGHYSEILSYPEVVIKPIQDLGTGEIPLVLDFDGLGESPL